MVFSAEQSFMVGPFEMAGQVDFPSKDRPFPTLLLVPGMPQHDRDGNVRGYPGYNTYFKPVIDTVLRSGWGIFRYDKGGTGKSSSGLAAAENMVAAYRKMISHPLIDKKRVGLLAFAGGSAHVYRKWMELEQINPIYQLSLLATGVNDNKLEGLNLPILLIAGAGRILRSQNALERYSQRTDQPYLCYEAETANEQLCDERKGKASLFKEGGCTFHQQSLNILEEWLQALI